MQRVIDTNYINILRSIIEQSNKNNLVSVKQIRERILWEIITKSESRVSHLEFEYPNRLIFIPRGTSS